MDGYTPSSSLSILFLQRGRWSLLFGLPFMRVLLASAARWFSCVVVLFLYLFAYLPISSLTVGIFKVFSSFLTYHGSLTIVPSIFDRSGYSLFTWLVATVPHSGVPHVQIDFIIVLYIFSLFPMLSLEFRPVSQYICLLFIRVLSIIDLVCCSHVNRVSKQSPGYLTWLQLTRNKANQSLPFFPFLLSRIEFDTRAERRAVGRRLRNLREREGTRRVN